MTKNVLPFVPKMLTRLDPNLPAIGDAETLFRFWHNTNDTSRSEKNLDTVVRPRKSNHADRWRALQKLGAIYLRQIIHQVLSNIFGKRNYSLNSLVFDHASSNGFFDILTLHYGLLDRVKTQPKVNPEAWKLRAAIFQAWIGGHIYERQLYDQCDALHELHAFLHALFLLRYRKLLKYMYHPSWSDTDIPRGKLKKPKVGFVKGSEDSAIRETFGTFLDTPGVTKDIGYFVTIESEIIEKNSVIYTAFSPSKAEASEMSELRLWTHPRNSLLSFFVYFRNSIYRSIFLSAGDFI